MIDHIWILNESITKYGISYNYDYHNCYYFSTEQKAKNNLTNIILSTEFLQKLDYSNCIRLVFKKKHIDYWISKEEIDK